MQSLLVFFGWFAVITSALVILVPYLRGRGDLISSWTLYQLGCANFLGLAAIQSGNAMSHAYIVPHPGDYAKFVLGGVVFYIVSIVTYYYFPLAPKIANRTFRKFGPRYPKVMLSLFPMCFLLTLGYLFVPNIQFLGQIMMIVGKAAIVVGATFCFVAWAQRPYNISLGIVSGIALLMALVTTNSEFGRRDFLSALLSVPICWYWLRGRYYNPARVLATGSWYVVVAITLLTGVGIARFARVNPDLNIVQAAWEKFRQIPASFSHPDSSKSIFGGDAVEASLAAIRLYDRIQPTDPFFTLKYIIVHPIPRAWWPNKPSGLGISLPKDTGFARAHYTAVNLGPGVVGHGYHEGGLFFIAFYAMLFASAARFFDLILARDPSNPYTLAALCAASGQIVALVRGEMGLFAVMIIGAFMAAMLMNYIARIFFGTEYLPTPEEAAQWQAYSDPFAQGSVQPDAWVA